MAIVIPVPIILKNFFSRKNPNPKDTIAEIVKATKKMKIKRVIGYLMCTAVCAWCTWSIIMFSIEFGHNTSQIWLLNFGITTIIDAVCTDVLVAVLLVLLVLYLPRIKEECKRRK